MTLCEAIERYILWRQAHGAKFTTGANLLRHFLGYADGDATFDAVTRPRFWPFCQAKGHWPGIARTSITSLPAFGATRPAVAMRRVRRCRTANRNRRPGRHRISTRVTSCGGSLTPRPWRAAGAVRFSSTQ